MRVILLQDIPGTGTKGEVKVVADGYARNFLLPKKMAKFATADTIAKLKQAEEKHTQHMKKELKGSQKVASKLDGAEIEIKEKVSETGTLYSALNSQRLADEIKKQVNLEVEASQIEIGEPIKETGEHKIVVKFPHELEAEVRILISEL